MVGVSHYGLEPFATEGVMIKSYRDGAALRLNEGGRAGPTGRTQSYVSSAECVKPTFAFETEMAEEAHANLIRLTPAAMEFLAHFAPPNLREDVSG